LLAFLLIYLNLQSQIPTIYQQNQSFDYYQIIKYYKTLDSLHDEAKLIEYGLTDVGKPLHLFVISPEKEFDAAKLHAQNKTIILINNGIHPGEPEGIDASVLMALKLLSDAKKLKKELGNVVLCIIPVYNIGGHLNRSAYHRANQQTPELHGYRGNARNLDLNRDFAKLKSQNAQSFVSIFQEWKPQIFLDTHTTDGSDHQYVNTLIATHPVKLEKPMKQFLNEKFVPYLYDELKKTPYEICPYVETMDWNKGPETGIVGFLDMPKFSTGYTSLFHSYSFMTENHIFKDYKDRVLSVWLFMETLIKFANENNPSINKTQKEAIELTKQKTVYVTDYEMDTTKFEWFNFKGYESEISKSPLTGLERVVYNQNKKYQKNIPYLNQFIATKSIRAPYAYLLSQAYPEVIHRLKLNGVKMNRLACDTTIELNAYYIDNYKKTTRPQQGQFPNYDLNISIEKMPIQCFEGDYIIELNQHANEYIVQMLEPDGMDSFFKWNFFDEILEHREYFSPIGFEENAIAYLLKHPELKQQLDQAVQNDTTLAQSHYLQLKFIYDNSEFAEKKYRRLPVYRIETKIKLPVK